jgi:polyhydroxybutyrate depolymerase
MKIYALILITLIGCEKTAADEQPYRINGTMIVDGMRRTYLLNLPPGYYKDSIQFALVIGLHGLGGSATEFEHDYSFSDKANSAGFIAVYPEGVPSKGPLELRSWNAGNCCDYAMQHNIDDVKYISQLIDRLKANYKINAGKVYVTGMSNGAMMTYRLACEIPGKIAAIAPVSGTLIVSEPCNPAHSVPILHIHSAIDTKVPYYGGTGLAGYYFPPVDSGLHVWSVFNSCTSQPINIQAVDYTLTKWTDNTGNVMMECYLTDDGGHAWPGGLQSTSGADVPSTAINATDVVWDFFQHH